MTDPIFPTDFEDHEKVVPYPVSALYTYASLYNIADPDIGQK